MRHTGGIFASVTIENLLDPEKKILCDTLVDTGASPMVLPSTWRERLGKLEEVRELEFETAKPVLPEKVVLNSAHFFRYLRVHPLSSFWSDDRELSRLRNWVRSLQHGVLKASSGIGPR